MNERLKGMMGYLAGPMDEVPDMGIDWRIDIQNFIWALDCGVLNPCDKPTDFAPENDDTRETISI